MTTRSIVTSQPDVACDVCERRLLRGEQPDIFLARPATHRVRAVRPARRARGLAARERRRSVSHLRCAHGAGATCSGGCARWAGRTDASPEPDGTGEPYAGEPEPYDFLGGDGRGRRARSAQRRSTALSVCRRSIDAALDRLGARSRCSTPASVRAASPASPARWARRS